MSNPEPMPPQLDYLFSVHAALSTRVDTGESPLGRRSFNGVSSGRVDGPRLRGILLPGAADWMLTRRDGSNVVDARVILQTHDGAAIYMSYAGRAVIPADRLAEARDPARRGDMDPGSYYFRTTPAFETGAPEYAWLNNVVSVGVGRLTAEGLRYDVFGVA